jgi:cytochrome c oxidase subunit 2
MIFNKLSERLSAALAGVLSMLFVSAANAEYALNMTRGVTPISRDLYGLHMIVLWICVAIGVVEIGRAHV